MHQWFSKEHRGVVGQVAGGEIVGGVDDQIEFRNQAPRELRREALGVGLDLDVGVQRQQPCLGHLGLGPSHIGFGEEHLPVQVRPVDPVKFDHPDPPHTGRGEVEERGTPQATRPHHQNRAGFQPTLSLFANARQHEVPGIPGDFTPAPQRPPPPLRSATAKLWLCPLEARRSGRADPSTPLAGRSRSDGPAPGGASDKRPAPKAPRARPA